MYANVSWASECTANKLVLGQQHSDEHGRQDRLTCCYYSMLPQVLASSSIDVWREVSQGEEHRHGAWERQEFGLQRERRELRAHYCIDSNVDSTSYKALREVGGVKNHNQRHVKVSLSKDGWRQRSKNGWGWR